MGIVDPKFPSMIWDGLSANPDRYERAVVADPDARDWDRITAELIAVQNYLAGLPTNPDGDLFSLYSNDAAETIVGGQWIIVQSDGELAIATSNDGKVSGLTVTGAVTGEEVVYMRQGRVVALDWTNTTGSSELVPGADYYLTTNGGMSVTAPTSGYVVKLGQAQSITNFDVDIKPSIKL